ncbi:hypothetical protein M2475_001818 [Breznakia sp. PF5-3]|uniref:hypothetical protein n=1 Tax=unclassified Breznakia TaxID=2623764 RepID=UPI00240542EC|nr:MULTISPECIES: hypothetical protein [unclassified Breznakia]MDF9825363.1 hypothetical protein [Breznakia sp. PM6-1]MDF9836241.1 hypothetical protein [Breznakia sp. PF5-3]MDF9838519.1 hypothetical protein [Breznakia sp. PFB2-8]MDF9860486.1 hypothetical protein [Breznakia sp. PH5-24]
MAVTIKKIWEKSEINYVCSQSNDIAEISLNLTYKNSKLSKMIETWRQPYDKVAVEKSKFLEEMNEDIKNYESQKGQTIEFIEQEEDYKLIISYDFEISKDYNPFQTRHYSLIISTGNLENEKEFIDSLKKSGFTCESDN